MVRKFIAIQLIFLSFLSVSAQEKSDREQWGLSGYVKSVREATAEIVVKEGRQVEKGRRLSSVKTYDVSGRLLTDYVYTDDGEILYGDTLIYDAAGKLVEKTTDHSRFVYLCDKKTYLYDQNGRRSEEICHLKDRGVIGKTISRYNQSGKLIEEERLPVVEAKLYFSEHTVKRYEYNSEGELIGTATFLKGGDERVPTKSSFEPHRSAEFSNDNARGSTRLDYDANGKLLTVTVSCDDEHGNEIESLVYFLDGRIKEGNRYSYSYDRKGNYLKEVEYEWVTDNGKAFFQPTEVTYRTIEYFTSKEVSKHTRAIRQ